MDGCPGDRQDSSLFGGKATGERGGNHLPRFPAPGAGRGNLAGMTSNLPEERDAPHSITQRRWALRMQQPLPSGTMVDRFFFLVGTASAVFLAVLGSILGVRNWWSVLMVIPVWGVLAYLTVPRLHRMLSDFYVPDYFFGRTRTTDGLLGDPVNLAVDGEVEQLDAVMLRAGWHRADDITPASTWGIVASTLTRRSYPTAPVSPLTLFGRRQDVAYQQEVAGNPKQRHHVRFWHTPPGWLLPGGTHVDWLGAGTYDTNVGLSLFTFQITHRIDENTDIERDHIIASVLRHNDAVVVHDLPHFTTGYHSRNGGGDQFVTDGNLPILDLNAVAVAGPVPASGTDDETTSDGALEPARGTQHRPVPLRRAPVSIVLAAVLALVVTGMSVASMIIEAISATEALGDTPDEDAWARGLVIAVGVVILLVQILLVRGVLRRGPRSRFALMLLLAVGVLFAAIDYLTGAARLGFNGTLLGATLQCLALIALTSASSAAWVRERGEDMPVG